MISPLTEEDLEIELAISDAQCEAANFQSPSDTRLLDLEDASKAPEDACPLYENYGPRYQVIK